MYAAGNAWHEGTKTPRLVSVSLLGSYRTSRLHIVMETASFKRVPQDCGHLAIQYLKTTAKLQLLVRYDALYGDFNDH